MAAASYEDECMRAELMGTQKPDYNAFLKRKQEVESEELEARQLQEAEIQNDELKATATKFDELNSILSKTQKKINILKYRCGTISGMFKTKLGSPTKSFKTKSNDEKSPSQGTTNDNDIEKVQEPAYVREIDVCVNANNCGPRKSQLSNALDYNLDKLDLLIDGAERAEVSMCLQNKQMKKYIKK